MKKIFSTLFIFVLLTSQVLAAPATLLNVSKETAAIKYNANAKTLTYAFVFDGPSDKNAPMLEQFKKAIEVSTAPEYKTSFPKDLIFTGDWTYSGIKSLGNKALASRANMVISLGYLSTKYFNSIQNKQKLVMTIDQYGLRDLGDGFFNPVQQSVKGAQLFARLFHFKKLAVLVNENFYYTKKPEQWAKIIKDKLPEANAVMVPINNNNNSVLPKLAGCDAVLVTPLLHITTAQRDELFSQINSAKLPTFSTLGKEDVEHGALMGAGAYDLDRKVAEATSFSIKGVLSGNQTKPVPVQFYEDEILYINQDTADLIGYQPHLRILNNAEVITKKKPTVYNLSAVFGMLENQNLDIARKKLLVTAARRSAVSAVLKYLPTFGITVGFQSYDHDYAESVKMSIPEKTGLFTASLEQVIYSPALVTNILIKKKKLDFSKSEEFLTEQNMGINVALLYVDTLMLENLIKVQKEYVKESRENLAIARVREKMGKCGQEESLRWAAQLNVNEQNLLDMNAELKNLKLSINKLLFKDQTENYELAPLKANDPAFYTSEINIIDYLATPESLEKFTQMIVEESYRIAPELAKLRAAIKMKNYEMAMYYQKFVLPDAKLVLEYTSLADRDFTGPTYLGPAVGTLPKPNATNLRFGMFAQWKPIEGGTKIAEIARIKAETDELHRYEDEVKTEIERHVRDTINKALAGYFSVEKNYKASYAAGENYQRVKKLYLTDKATIAQLVDAQHIYLDSKVAAMNSQYVFFKELLWVQRALCATNWTTADKDAHAFIQKIKDTLENVGDITLL